VAWIIFLVLAAVLIGLVVYIVFDESLMRIEPGQLGLLLVKGRATDKHLAPGPHWVPALRRREVQVYPSLELSLRVGGEDLPGAEANALERSVPRLRVQLGDRTTISMAYTLRFRIDESYLKMVHERFGPDGLWSAVRDSSARAVRNAMLDGEFRIEDLVGEARRTVEQRLAEDVSTALAADGFLETAFFLGDLDLGRSGEVIEATARARLELEREQAEAAMRLARARIDAELAPYLAAAATDAALRYREVDSWRELARAQNTGIVVPTSTRGPVADVTSMTEAAAAQEDQ
jgi:regulator of protease activity HflC (stomatin/prohibitin superfamily)